MASPRRVWWAAALIPLLLPSPAAAQDARNVLVVANRNSPASLEIADYYAQRRAVPASQVLRLAMPATDDIERSVFVNAVERPIVDWLRQNRAQDRILYIVLIKGVPLRVTGTAGASGTVASVDAELTLLYRRMLNVPIPLQNSIKNPYFLGGAPLGTVKPFTHRDHDIYLVTRLDGFTTADVKGLVDRAVAPSLDPAPIVFEPRGGAGAEQGDGWLRDAAKNVQEVPSWKGPARVVRVSKGARSEPLLGYYSWGSNNLESLFFREERQRFVPGALAGQFVSTDARTFQEPPAGWRAGRPFAGSDQSLVGTLIRDGVTGAAGYVAEPFLTAAVRPDILFPAYLRGLNLAEAFYSALPGLSWQSVIIGDPLCAPFRTVPVDPLEIDGGVDPITQLPQYFSNRQVAFMLIAGGNANRDAVRRVIRADQLVTSRNVPDAIAELEAAVKLDPQYPQAHLGLAALFVAQSRFEAAIEAFRRTIDLRPNSVPALNDLADLLARRGAAADALPFAKRAAALAPQVPEVADTLGWIHHLLGDNKAAEPLLSRAASALPNNAEVQFHLAVVLEASGHAARAVQILERARALNSTLDARADVQVLVERLRKAAPGFR